MKKIVFFGILACLFSLFSFTSCKTIEQKKDTLVGAVLKITTEKALKEVFEVDYSTIKDTLNVEKEVHYKKLERYTGESILTWFTYKGSFILQTLDKHFSILWTYDTDTKFIKFNIKIKK